VKKIAAALSLLALRAIPAFVAILAPAYAFGQGMPAPTPSSVGEKTAAQPGIEISIPLRDAKDAMVVYLPSNYTAEAKWPVIFWYHGPEGAPSTAFAKRHTGGLDFVIVGMAYAGEDNARTEGAHRAYLSRELANFHLARRWIIEHASVDQSRFFMAGISRGGWLTSMLCDLEMRDLAGIAILLAGRLRSSTPVVGEFFKGKPVYIGVGDKDPNLLPSLQGRELYRRHGATLTYEEYAGLDHQEPAGIMPLFAAWLKEQGSYRKGIPVAERARLEEHFRTSLRSIMIMDDPLAKYERLAALCEDPGLASCAGTTAAMEIESQLSAMRTVSPMKEEWAAEQSFCKLLWQSMNVVTLAQMKQVLDSLHGLGIKSAGTRYGKLACELEKGVAKAYQKSVEATERAKHSK